MISLVFYDNDITKKKALFFRQSQPLHLFLVEQIETTTAILTHTWKLWVSL